MRDRFRLLFGPYRTPRFEYGDVVQDERRGEVEIVGLTDGKIPWPVGIPTDRRVKQQRVIVLYGALVDAVRRESVQAIAHHWGVTPQTVSIWRRLLDVPRVNSGTKRVLQEEYFIRATKIHSGRRSVGARKRHRLAMIKVMRDPAVREKIGRANRGKKPFASIAALKARAKTRPDRWTRDEDKLCRSLLPFEVARITKRSVNAVYKRRSLLGLPDLRPEAGKRRRGRPQPAHLRAFMAKNGFPRTWTARHDQLCRTLSVKEVSKRTGHSLAAVYHRRLFLGVTRRRRLN